MNSITYYIYCNIGYDVGYFFNKFEMNCLIQFKINIIWSNNPH